MINTLLQYLFARCSKIISLDVQILGLSRHCASFSCACVCGFKSEDSPQGDLSLGQHRCVFRWFHPGSRVKRDLGALLITILPHSKDTVVIDGA